MEAMPEEEEAEMAALYRAEGLHAGRGRRRSPHRLFEDPERALDTLDPRGARASIPDELGSPSGAAAGSFVAFALGAVVPVIPYLLGVGVGAFVASDRAEPRRRCSVVGAARRAC